MIDTKLSVLQKFVIRLGFRVHTKCIDRGRGVIKYYAGWCDVHRVYFEGYEHGGKKIVECPRCRLDRIDSWAKRTANSRVLG